MTRESAFDAVENAILTVLVLGYSLCDSIRR